MASSTKALNMATLKTIAAALKLVDSKKENLKRAFDDLQAYSSLLSPSFALSWDDLDSHFTTIQTSLTHRFRLLESRENNPSNPPPESEHLGDPAASRTPDIAPSDHPSSSSNPNSIQVGFDAGVTRSQSNNLVNDPSCSYAHPSHDQVDSVVTRPELRELCEGMDGKGLRKYVNDHVKEREAIRAELLGGGMRYALDPGAMILNAMEGFFSGNLDSKGDKDPELSGLRRSCVFLLEVLMGLGTSVVSSEVRERARKLALEWKARVSVNGENPLEAFGFLHLVAAYGLRGVFDLGELVDYFVVVARWYRQATALCQAIGLGDKASDIVQKLINNGKQLLAVKFIFEFRLTDKFPPIPLLEAYLKESKMLANKVCREGNNSLRSLNEATAKEVSAMKAVIKVIEEHNLESEYPREVLEKRIEMLEKQKADRKRPAAAPVTMTWQQQAKQQPEDQQNGNKRPRTTASVVPAPVPMSAADANPTLPSVPHSHVQPTGLLPDHPNPYLGSAAVPYGLVGSTPALPHYAGPSAGLYGLVGAPPIGFPGGNPVPAGAPLGFSGNPVTAGTQFYPLESQMPSGYYDGSTSYGGYGLQPQYHPSYYPQ